MSCRALVASACTAFLVALAACSEPGQVAVTPRPTPAATPATKPADAATALTPTQHTAVETSVELAASRHTLNGTNLRLVDLISVAYRTPEKSSGALPLLSDVRVSSAEPLPATRYDVRIYVPAADAGRLRAALRQALRESFGLVAHAKPRETDALVLTAPTGRVDAFPPAANAPPEPGFSRIDLTGDDLSLLAEQLEERLGRPVVNETNLQASYRLRLFVPLKDGKGQAPTLAAVQEALRDQLGLDLAPGRRAVEFLIVEHVAVAP